MSPIIHLLAAFWLWWCDANHDRWPQQFQTTVVTVWTTFSHPCDIMAITMKHNYAHLGPSVCPANRPATSYQNRFARVEVVMHACHETILPACICVAKTSTPRMGIDYIAAYCCSDERPLTIEDKCCCGMLQEMGTILQSHSHFPIPPCRGKRGEILAHQKTTEGMAYSSTGDEHLSLASQHGSTGFNFRRSS